MSKLQWTAQVKKQKDLNQPTKVPITTRLCTAADFERFYTPISGQQQIFDQYKAAGTMYCLDDQSKIELQGFDSFDYQRLEITLSPKAGANLPFKTVIDTLGSPQFEVIYNTQRMIMDNLDGDVTKRYALESRMTTNLFNRNQPQLMQMKLKYTYVSDALTYVNLGMLTGDNFKVWNQLISPPSMGAQGTYQSDSYEIFKA